MRQTINQHNKNGEIGNFLLPSQFYCKFYRKFCIKQMLVIIAVVAYAAVAHTQTFYPAAFSYQNTFVRNIPPQPFVVNENQGMERFTKAQVNKPSNFADRENKGEYEREYKGKYASFTAQRNDDHYNRDRFERFQSQY